jgi:hypothetical protein
MKRDDGAHDVLVAPFRPRGIEDGHHSKRFAARCREKSMIHREFS